MNDEDNQQHAVIYCRVSSAQQKTRGDGLNSQKTRCREYAKYKGYTVEKVFTDDMSGSVTKRPGMQAMLSHLRKCKHPRVVLIDDISRLARGIEAHLQLRSAISNTGATLESPSIEFGEDSDSILVENMLASVSQHQRQKNSEQTLNRMKARLSNGYWVFQAPIGYRYEKAGQGKKLVRDEPVATIIQEALEGYANGRFQIQAEVKRFLESFPEYPRDNLGEVRNQRVTQLLTRVMYAGYVENEDWSISLRKGQHDPLISFETYQKNQTRLNSAARVPARKNLNVDFPLRGFVTCGDCDHPLTACWSKGKSKKYPYYLCHHRGCDSYRKSIPRDEVEGEFDELVKSLRPTESLFGVAKVILSDLWEHRLKSVVSRTQSIKKELKKIEKQTEQFLDRIVDSNSSTVVTAYEERITRLEKRKMVIEEKLQHSGKSKHTFDEMFEHAMQFLSNPWKLWASDRLELKHTVLKLAFADRLAYYRNKGFRTPENTLPFKALRGFCGSENKVARPEGFEPPTTWFEARPSIVTY